MARIEFAPDVFEDFDHLLDHMARFGVEDPAVRLRAIVQAIQILTHSPLIGRPVRSGRRELVIGRDAQGNVVLYRFVPSIDVVFVLAVRSQRESGYKTRR